MGRHFDFEEKKKIEELLKQEKSPLYIALQLNRSVTGIEGEINNNGGFGDYSAEESHKKYLTGRKALGKKMSKVRKGVPIKSNNFVTHDELKNLLREILRRFFEILDQAVVNKSPTKAE